MNNYDYMDNMEKATDEHNRKNGYVKDPRVPEQPGWKHKLKENFLTQI